MTYEWSDDASLLDRKLLQGNQILTRSSHIRITLESKLQIGWRGFKVFAQASKHKAFFHSLLLLNPLHLEKVDEYALSTQIFGIGLG